MSQPANRRSVLLWVIGLMAVVALGTILAIHGSPGEIESPRAIDTTGGRALGQAADGAVSGAVDIDPVGGTLPVGSSLPAAEYCAEYANRVGSDRESVPANARANTSVPTDLRLPPWPDFWDPSANGRFVRRIDGQYKGTTDQIIVWGACKWGIDTDVVRAMAMAESSWRQDKVGDYVDDPALCVGDYSVPCPTSFGVLQIKHFYRPGSWPNSQQHTAFNVDYALAVLRGCFEGWVTYLGNGYTAGDLWGCAGWHYSGEWKDDPGLEYIQRVQHWLGEKPWIQ